MDEEGYVTHAMNQVRTVGETYLEPGKGKYVTDAAYSAAMTQLQGLYAAAPTQAARDVYKAEMNRLLKLAQRAHTPGHGIYQGGML